MNRESAWQEAYQWLCQQRKNAPADSDVWHLRFHWERDGEAFRQRVEQGEYRLKAMRVVKRLTDDPIAMWDADDAMVLKWVALQIQDVMPVHPKCHHVKGAGVHYSRREIKDALDSGEYKFVYRTDIRGYYQHMQKSQLNALVQKWVEDPILLDLVEQYIAYSVEDGGEFHTPVNGISRGCALSPLLGASLLYHVDELFAGKTDLFYARYMDDFLVLSKKRWPLRRAIRLLNEQMNAGGFALHPDKTQIGRVEKGSDWLGLWFNEKGIRRSPRSLQLRANKILGLYEQMRLRVKRPIPLSKSFSTILLAFLLMPVASFFSSAFVFDLGEIGPDATSNYTPANSSPTRSSTLVDQNSGTVKFNVTSLVDGTACSTIIPWSFDVLRSPSGGAQADAETSASSYPIVTAEEFVLEGYLNEICHPEASVSGPFSEKIGEIVQTNAGGAVIGREDVSVVGVWRPRTCSVDTRTLNFGDLTVGRPGETLTTISDTLITTCNVNYLGHLPATITLSSAASDAELFVVAADSPVGVRIRDLSSGGPITPGVPSPLRTNRGIPLAYEVSVVQRTNGTLGAFSIPVDVTLTYN